MFTTLFFIVPIVYTVLTFIFYICLIEGVTEKLPKDVSFQIGKLDKEDICSLSKSDRNNLRSLILTYLGAASVVTAIIGAAFILAGMASSPLAILACDIIEFAVAILALILFTKKINRFNHGAMTVSSKK